MISEISSKCSKRSIWSEISPMAFILRLKLFLLALFFKIHAAMSQTWVFDLYSPMFCCFLCNSVLSFFKPLFSVARPVFKPYIYGFSAGEKRQLSLLSTVGKHGVTWLTRGDSFSPHSMPFMMPFPDFNYQGACTASKTNAQRLYYTWDCIWMWFLKLVRS